MGGGGRVSGGVRVDVNEELKFFWGEGGRVGGGGLVFGGGWVWGLVFGGGWGGQGGVNEELIFL